MQKVWYLHIASQIKGSTPLAGTFTKLFVDIIFNGWFINSLYLIFIPLLEGRSLEYAL